MYSADTHHQSQIARGPSDYLLYANPLCNKAGYPLMRCHCYYCGWDIGAVRHRPSANDWLRPAETRWWNWKMIISGSQGYASHQAGKKKKWQHVLSSFVTAGKGLAQFSKQWIFAGETPYHFQLAAPVCEATVAQSSHSVVFSFRLYIFILSVESWWHQY